MFPVAYDITETFKEGDRTFTTEQKTGTKKLTKKDDAMENDWTKKSDGGKSDGAFRGKKRKKRTKHR